VELGAYGLTVTPEGSRVYVACIDGAGGSGSVDVIDVASNTVIDSIPTDPTNDPQTGRGPLPIAITPNGSRAYVTFQSGETGVIDTTTNGLLPYINATPGYFGIAINPAGTQAYVTNFVDSSGVAVIDIATNTVIDRISTGTASTGVAFTPDGTRAYVANAGGNFVSVIDTASRTLMINILVGVDPWGVAITPDGSRAYVTVRGSNSIAVIDTTNNTVVDTISLTATPFDIAIANPASAPAVVTVAATDPTAAEVGSNGNPDPGTFTITRSGGTTIALTVNFTLTGTATPGTDYNNVSTSVTIPAGQASATVSITPKPDTQQAEGNETVILTLASGTGYTIGSPNTATVNITDYVGGALRGPAQVNFNNNGPAKS
jgi:YVTN family beta-propeller protein